MTKPLIHIIVVLYNSDDAFSTLWQHLVAQHCQEWRLVAIDNASLDGSADTLHAITDPRLTAVVNGTNLGFADGVNQGLRRAVQDGATHCMLLNPDTVLPPYFLQELTDRWHQNGWPVIAPRVMRLEDPSRSWYAGGHLEYGWIFANRHDDYNPDDATEPKVVDFASGCCLGVSTETLRKVGLLDESFFVYWEDTDFCMRLKEAGIPIHYLPEPFLLHEGGGSSGGETSHGGLRLFYKGYVLFLRKHFGLRVALATMARVFLRERERPSTDRKGRWIIVSAMLQGLRARFLQEPCLDGPPIPPHIDV